MMNVRNQVVLVVGASSGMGRAVARKLAEAGAKLVITARRKERLEELASEIQANGGECLALVADALDEAAAEHVVASAVDHFGKLDVAFLNAGGAPAIDMRKMTASDVKLYMRTNYDVTVNYLFPVLEHMKQRRSGLIVHNNSLAGFIGVPLQGPYSAAKGACRLLIDNCRVEFREFGINFLSVYPGFIATEATRDDGMPAPLEISEDQAANHIVNAIRAGRRDYLFPASMRWVIRLARVLPKPVLNWVLGFEVKPLGAGT